MASTLELTSPPHFPVVGVVGDGQLARMMQSAAIPLGITLHVLRSDAPAHDIRNDASAAQVVPSTTVGRADDTTTMTALANQCDVITFEHEHVPAAVLTGLETAGHSVQPGSAALRYAHNKLHMRQHLTQLGHPCPAWWAATSETEIAAALTAAGGEIVVKTPTGGYDGKGVKMISGAVPPGEFASWFDRHDTLLVEERVPYLRELSVLVARSPSGQGAAWPIAETTQKDGVCDEVISPAPGLAAADAEHLTRLGLNIAADLNVTGVLAVELFERGPGDYCINELAMRPHNTGHWTIDGAVTSQFEQHLRAVLDLPLGDPAATSPWSVMVNIMGGNHQHMYPAYRHVMAHDPGVKVHLYGKQVRPGRKIGHVTVCGTHLPELRRRARHAADYFQGVING